VPGNKKKGKGYRHSCSQATIMGEKGIRKVSAEPSSLIEPDSRREEKTSNGDRGKGKKEYKPEKQFSSMDAVATMRGRIYLVESYLQH